MKRLIWLVLVVACCAATSVWAGGAWRQVDPYWQDAYILSFRSGDLLTQEADERWGQKDGRLSCGGVISTFPTWLASHADAIQEARRHRRKVLLSLHMHSGYGTGLVSYTPDIQTAEVVNYPWLLRVLSENGLSSDRVTVAIDTCNAQAVAAMQIRPDLIPGGVGSFSAFKKWRSQAKARQSLPLDQAWQLFARDRVASHLYKPALGRRSQVTAVPYQPLSRDELKDFRARLYGQKGVILATPAFFNLLRLGPEPKGTLTANLLKDPLSPAVVDSLLTENKAEFKQFREFAFLDSAGLNETRSDDDRRADQERREVRQSRRRDRDDVGRDRD